MGYKGKDRKPPPNCLKLTPNSLENLHSGTDLINQGQVNANGTRKVLLGGVELVGCYL